MRISLKDSGLVYSGRIDKTNPEKPEFVFPATSLSFRFYGKKASLLLENKRVCWDNYVGAIVDGSQKKWKVNPEGMTTIQLVDDEEEAMHEVLFFKRQDSCHVIILHELTLDEEASLQPPAEKPVRRIEVYGDSVSAGEVSEAVEYVGRVDPEHNGEYSNSWYSYAWIAARKLNAEIHDVSQGGIPLLNGTGWVAPPVYPGMEFMWDKLHYHPQSGKVSEWDFKEYTPHLVIVAIGQNDNHPDDYMSTDFHGMRADYWKYKYGELIKSIREKYPKAVILLTTTILQHSVEWDDAIDEVCRGLQDDRIFHFLYKRNGSGTPGHIRIPEAEEMADELVDYINHLDIPIW